MVKINKKLLILLLVVSLLLGAGGVLALAQFGVGGTRLLSGSDIKEYEEQTEKYAKLNELMDYIGDNYYKPVDEAQLMEGTYKGLFEALNDPYSEYVQASGNEEFMNEMLGTFYGIGMTFMQNDDNMFEVVGTRIGSPAEKAEIKPGELVLSVNGEATEGHSSDEVRDLIRGDKDTNVTLKMRRPNGDEYEVSLKRDLIHDITVDWAMMDDGIGYIRITQFAEKTDEEFRSALAEVTSGGAVALVVDLRYNGGGLVDVAVRVADELMDAGTVVYAVNGKGQRTAYVTKKGRTELPFALLVNEYSASASEIVAAGIKDNKEGILVGTRTFGKGIIQESYERPDKSIVKLTIMQYFSPSGNPIHEIGVAPDYVVELPYDAETDYQYEKAAELLLNEINAPEADIQGEGIAKN